jgi:hypothetical protein
MITNSQPLVTVLCYLIFIEGYASAACNVLGMLMHADKCHESASRKTLQPCIWYIVNQHHQTAMHCHQDTALRQLSQAWHHELHYPAALLSICR